MKGKAICEDILIPSLLCLYAILIFKLRLLKMRIAYKHKRDGIKISSHIAFPFISFSQNFLPTSLHFLLHHVASLLISFYCIRFEVLSPEIKFIMQVNTYHYYRNGLLPRLKPPIYHGSTVVTAPVALAQL